MQAETKRVGLMMLFEKMEYGISFSDYIHNIVIGLKQIIGFNGIEKSDIYYLLLEDLNASGSPLALNEKQEFSKLAAPLIQSKL
jgi:hypothetical protein